MSTTPKIDFSKYEQQSVPQIDFSKYDSSAGPTDQWLIEHSYAKFPGRDKNGQYNPLPDSDRASALKEFNNRSAFESLLDKGEDLVIDPFVHHVEGAMDATKQGQYAHAGNEAFKAATPFALASIPEATAVRPFSTLFGIGTGVVGSKVVEGLGKEAGFTPDQAELAGNIGGVGIGTGFGVGTAKLGDVLRVPLKELAAKNGGTGATILDLLEMEHPVSAARREVVKYLRAKLAQENPAEAEAETEVEAGALPAPYRLSGDQIVDAKTATPKQIIGPERQLPAAPPEPVEVQPPKTSQVLKGAGVTQAMKDAGVAAPSASMNPVRVKTGSLGISGSLAPRADIQFPPGLNGEDAAMMQLTRYNITELRAGAMKRGLPVSAGDTHSTLINKIADSMTPEETQAFTGAAQASKVVPSKFPENNLMAQNLNEAAAQLQAQKGSPYEVASLRNAANTIQQYPKTLSDIDFSAEKIKGIDKRITKRIQDFMDQQKVVPEDGPQVPNGNESGPGSQFDLLMRSLAKVKGAGTP